MKINALTIKAKSLLNAIVTPVTLKNTFDGKYIKTNGICGIQVQQILLSQDHQLAS